MASNKRKQDEKHLKILREIVALAHNKQCFDCHQRGPTYINMTIGSFVCTACSGLLRGLNPPHRVKSISMASFTPEEMDFIKCHGNEFCRKVWLGLYDNRLGSQSESRDETKVKDFMVQKYERKRYYTAPTDALKEEAKRMNESAISKAPGTKPLKSLLGENAPKITLGSHQPKPVSATPPPIGSTPQSPGNQSLQSSKSSGSTAMDLLGDLGGSDPFASSTPAQPQGGFADFASFGSNTSQPPPFSQSAPLQPAGSGTPAQQPQSTFNGFGAAPNSTPAAQAPAPGAGGDKYSNLSDLFSMAPTEAQTQAQPTGWSSTMSTGGGGGGGVNWNSSSSTGTSSASSTGINWGGEGTSSAGAGGLNWNSSSSQPAQQPGTSGMSWGGSSNASWGAPAPATAQSNGIGAPGNPFLHSNVSNPFGGGSNTSLSSQSTMGAGAQPQAANPFRAQQGAQPGGGFGAFGNPQNTPSQGAGFGQFGGNTAVSSGAGFGQMGGVQNGGFGAPPSSMSSAGFGGQGFGGAQPGFGQQQQQQQQPSGFGGMPGSGFGGQQQQQGFGGQPAAPGGFGGQAMQGFGAPQQQAAGGWGQPASSAAANPFMSTAQQQQYSAPNPGATNPFL